MGRNVFPRLVAIIAAAFVRASLSAMIAIAVSSSASRGQANSLKPATLSQEAPATVSGQEEMPLDAFGYVGGLLEARFYEPQSTAADKREEIGQAEALYGGDWAMR